jgi:predicted nuclease of predicted toxin-antitoxin system
MKICVDENIPLVTVSELKTLQHDVLDIRQTPAQGMSDDRLWDLATKERRLFITTDKGFAQHRNEPHHGILIVRLRQPNEERIHDRVMQAIGRFAENEWSGLTVVMRDAVQSVSRSNWGIRE